MFDYLKEKRQKISKPNESTISILLKRCASAKALVVHREQCITLSMDKCGWSRRQAKAYLNATRARTGNRISYNDYRRYYFFNIPAEQQVERYEEILKTRKARENRKGNERKKYIHNIMGATGWNKKTALAKIKDAQIRTGATFKDYYAFKFWEIDEVEQSKYFTQKMSNAISNKYDKNEFHKDILLNKELSCYYFSNYFHRPWCISREVTFEEFKEIFAETNKVVYKPLDGNGGLGVKIYDITGKIREVYLEIQTLSRGVVEGFVAQHPDMASFSPSSVNTVRVVTICDGKSTEIAYVAMRVGSGKSVVDNFTDGGMVVGVDMETGIVVTPGCTISAVPFEEHPETGIHFRGFQIPYYKEVLELVKEAGKTITGYIGWDIAITVDGPVLIEANIMPGNRILQMPYVHDRIGKMDVMKRFL